MSTTSRNTDYSAINGFLVRKIDTAIDSRTSIASFSQYDLLDWHLNCSNGMLVRGGS